METATIMTSVVFAGSALINIFIGAPLNLLWSIINSYQLVVLLIGLNFKYPAAVQQMFGLLALLANFDLLPSEDINMALFDFSDTVPYSRKIELIGFESSNFILNTGTFLLVHHSFVILLIIALLFKLLKCLNSILFTKPLNFIKNFANMNSYILFLQEGAIELFLCAYI